MISVTRKIHIPSVLASFCWSRSAKWWTSGPRAPSREPGGWAADPARAVSDMERFLHEGGVVVDLLVDLRRPVEVVRGRRRRGLPLEPGGRPRVRGRVA